VEIIDALPLKVARPAGLSRL